MAMSDERVRFNDQRIVFALGRLLCDSNGEGWVRTKAQAQHAAPLRWTQLKMDMDRAQEIDLPRLFPFLYRFAL